MPIDVREIKPDIKYTLKDLASVLGLSYGSVLNMKKVSALPFVQIGKKFFVQGSAILEYVNRDKKKGM
jgi:hypothetical protein